MAVQRLRLGTIDSPTRYEADLRSPRHSFWGGFGGFLVFGWVDLGVVKLFLGVPVCCLVLSC